MEFLVTEKAMRPASNYRGCFYCRELIGSKHKDDCVLIIKKVKIRMTIDYEVDFPADWDKKQIEFSRNDSSWCADNAISEIEKVGQEWGCLCGIAKFKYLQDTSGPYLKENG